MQRASAIPYPTHSAGCLATVGKQVREKVQGCWWSTAEIYQLES